MKPLEGLGWVVAGLALAFYGFEGLLIVALAVLIVFSTLICVGKVLGKI